MKRTLLRHKNPTYPSYLKTVDGIRDIFKKENVMEKYGYNLENDARFYAGTVSNEKHGFTVFASQFVINFIQKNIAPKSRCYLMDGTFDKLPRPFYQLLIISIEYQNDVSNFLKLVRTSYILTF